MDIVNIETFVRQVLFDVLGLQISHALLSVLRFGYLGKWSPCVCESLNTKGETITLITLLYVLISL
jgi:hypothetical protein